MKNFDRIALVTAGCLALYIIRVYLSGEFFFGFLIWNLVLGMLPFLFAVFTIGSGGLVRQIAFGSAWLLFLPNSFYVFTDLIHLSARHSSLLWFDLVLVLSFSITSALYGYLSIGMMERRFLDAIKPGIRIAIRFFLFGLIGYGIYLGRVQRWNSWDVLVNPMGLLSDMYHSLFYSTTEVPVVRTTTFFALFLLMGYYVLLHARDFAHILPSGNTNKIEHR